MMLPPPPDMTREFGMDIGAASLSAGLVHISLALSSCFGIVSPSKHGR
jgi:hypothetical protein